MTINMEFLLGLFKAGRRVHGVEDVADAAVQMSVHISGVSGVLHSADTNKEARLVKVMNC
jgi:hypothetical protein